jgi:hypothetical protein
MARVSFADTAFTTFAKAGESIDLAAMGATCWNPKMCFGSLRTVYFDLSCSCESVEKTSPAVNFP